MPYTRLIARLTATAHLTPEDANIILALPSAIETFKNTDLILRQGDIATHCAIVMSGFLAREKVIGDRNQILSLHVPGDMPDLHSLHLPTMDHDLRTAGPSAVAFVPHSALSVAVLKSATLMHTLWRQTLVDAAIFREWLANVGARDALERLAHLFCELASRLEVVGLVEANRFSMPLRQVDLADACGMSAVHVNRTLQELRRRNLLSWESQTVEILDRDALEELAQFEPDYLHHRQQASQA
jgi:CRP-like cAMP-binding protein